MAVEILVRVTDNDKVKKGYPATIRDVALLDEWPWGNREGLPDYVRLRITDATEEQVRNYLDDWKTEFNFELLVQNASGRRYSITCNPAALEAFGVDAAFKQDFRDWLEIEYGAELRSWDPVTGTAVFDIPNTDWADLFSNVLDLFEERLDVNRYMFSSADVDLAVANGGYAELTTAQVLARIIDRAA